MKNKALPFIFRFLLAFYLFLSFFTTAIHAETPLISLNYDLSSDGTVAIIPLNLNMVTAAKDLVQQMQTTNIIPVSSMVYAPPGLPPYMVLSGNSESLQQALNLLQRLFADHNSTHLIIIAASLRELTQSNSRYIGINPIPTFTGRATIDWNKSTDIASTRTDTKHLEASSSDIASLNEALNNSKVLVSSEVYTPNGIKSQISNIKSVPIFSTDNQGNVQTQFQNLETSISVIPTVMEYNEDKPEDSIIRVDVDIKVSIISGSSVLKGVSAPESSVKTMTTTRMLPADNHIYVIGTFITDNDTKSTSDVPILGKIPLLKYLFSQEHTEKQRNTAVLTLAVRLITLTINRALALT
ncbi:type II and III secretion system protein [Pelosinus fermentans]|uniref:Type II and III secretion system protein n=1 Tax=Pelosinus fermentans JBW45 TaxID=1192197 RepID=I8TRN5_9FIRM|nr:type II and III secretion system protein [Pelosinus fermentans]AJQ25909.1 type II and III secretion system protein [Pelosinus fermentans JBW45]